MFVYKQPAQLPAVDDINPDALEYLFASEQVNCPEPPWVVMAGGAEAVQTPATERLQAKIDILLGQLEITMHQLQSAHYEAGYLKAKLADADQQLKLLADYRARAAAAIIGEHQKKVLKEQVLDLENQLEALQRVMSSKLEEPSPAPDDQIGFVHPSRRYASAFHSASGYRQGGSIALMPYIYVLMIGFAAAVLATILS